MFAFVTFISTSYANGILLSLRLQIVFPWAFQLFKLLYVILPIYIIFEAHNYAYSPNVQSRVEYIMWFHCNLLPVKKKQDGASKITDVFWMRKQQFIRFLYY